MPPPNPATVLEIRVVVVAKLPLPVMLAVVGAWPISSAAAGRATVMAPTESAASVVAVASTLPVRGRRNANRRGAVARGPSSCTGVTPSQRDHGPVWRPALTAGGRQWGLPSGAV